MKSAKTTFAKVRKCQYKSANTISVWSSSVLQKNATINYMTACYFFHKVLAFFNIWIETMFNPMQYIGFAAKNSIFHRNCCYSCAEVLKWNLKQERDGRRKKKKFQVCPVQLHWCAWRCLCSCRRPPACRQLMANCVLQFLSS